MTQGNQATGAGRRSLSERATLAALAALAVLMLTWRWIGFQGGDDKYYAEAALDWIEHFPALGASHWALRYPVVLSIAASFVLLGKSTFAIGVVSSVFYAGILALDYIFLRHWFGWRPAALATLLSVLVPALPVQATYADCDVIEAFFIVASLWLYLLARLERARSWVLVASGIMAGLAFLTRETAVVLLLFYGLLFLFSPGMARRAYVVAGLGVALVVGAQMAYFAVRTGDPLYRQTISAHHDVVDRDHQIAATRQLGKVIDGEGVLSVNKYADPLLIVLVSQKFGLLFALAVPAALWASFRADFEERRRQVMRAVSALALMWFLFISLAGSILYLVPRYYILAALLLCFPLAVAGERLLGRRNPWAMIAAAGLGLSSLGLMYLENIHPQLSEQLLVETVRAAVDPVVYTDPKTLGRARFPLELAGLAGRVSAAPPPPGALVVLRPGTVEECRIGTHCPAWEV
ncbi:MAG TPA: glycosyltransferase family 39 protein, partial [Magnetospirillum sp.]|nr:glycosyltransferase family 39 protein [Magnetospirillum sp.]